MTHCYRIQSLFSSTAILPQFGAYEIVTPARVNEAGDKLPTGVHFKRRKRSTGPITGNISHHWTSPHVYYQISAFGQDYYLNLTLESGFIAPVYTVTILGASSEGHNSEEGAEDTEYQHCFYKGHVNAGQEHTAVISLCSGLVSFKCTIIISIILIIMVIITVSQTKGNSETLQMFM